MKYCGTSAYHRKMFQTLIPFINNIPCIQFDNEHGFAVFQPGKLKRLHKSFSVMELDECRLASVGAMMFYGFNLVKHPDIFFLQKIPIRILAYTLYWMSLRFTTENSSPNWWEKMIPYEMCSTSHRYNPVAFEKACLNFLIAHEFGHTYIYKDNRIVLDFLYSLGLKNKDIYQPAFPNPYDLSAWARIKSGCGTKRDICFILGDLLANLVAISAGLPELEHALLRAFNWSLVSPPSAKKRPRGNILFLRYSRAKNLSALFSALEEIFISIQQDKTKTADLMLKLEQKAWDELAVKYNTLTARKVI